jgi:predicted amidohydrolase YtcJ
MDTRDSPAKIAAVIIHNGNIATLNKERPFAKAVAIADGRIFFCGRRSQVKDAGGKA